MMYSPNAVLRRYTPPTCTLEIAAKSAPLSRWFGRPLVEKLKFSLYFDDPRIPEEKRVTIRGDKTQLDDLCQAVQAYVQNFLDQSPDRLNASFLAPLSNENSALSDTDTESSNGKGDPSGRLEIEQLESVNNQQRNYEYPYHSSEAESPADSPNIEISQTENQTNQTPLLVNQSTGIYFQSDGLISHDLFLGSLATAESGPVIHLTLLQLFDLATALDEYAADVETLPTQSGNVSRKLPVTTLRIAAMALVTVGLTGVAFKLLQPKNSTPETSATTASAPQTPPTEEPPIAAAPLPQSIPGIPTPPPSVSSPQTLPALPPSASNLVPATPGSTSPLGSGVPTAPGGTPPLGSGVPTAPGGTPPLGSTVPTAPGGTPPLGSTVPPSGNFPPTTASPVAPTPNALSANTNNLPATTGTSQVQLYKLPPNAGASSGGTTRTARPNARDNRAVVQMVPSQTTQSPQRREQPIPKQPPVVVAPAPLGSPPPFPAPPPLVAPSAPEPNQPFPPAQIATKPQPRLESRSVPRPAGPERLPKPATVAPDTSFSTVLRQQQAVNSPVTPNETLKEIPPIPTYNSAISDQLAARGSTVIPQPTPSGSPAAERNNNQTLFDTIPQVGEARKYFQNRWQPPSSLTQRLEYSLSLNPNGSIRQIIPLGQVAETYLDRTEMPLLGETFVSPVDGKRSPKIRVVLNPDGKVETFLESLN